MQDLFLELIQIVVGTREKLSRVPSEGDWQLIYEMAVKQSLVGVALHGIEELRAKNIELKVPQVLLLQWIGEVKMIELQNKRLNEAAVMVHSLFKSSGLRSCVLKGQGVARLYDVRCKKEEVRGIENQPETWNLEHETNTCGVSLSLRRQPGDIDIWVEGGRDKILKFLKEKHLKTGKIVIHHVDANIVDGIETEVHFLPSYTYDLVRYIKYRRFFKEEANQQFENFDEQGGFAYPTNRFNAVYLMMHIFHHVFHEGIGLRQLMDYYFVLTHLTDEERQWAYKKLKWLGLGKVTSAVMYVMKTVFQIDDRYLLCKPSKETGEFLLEEIFKGGNFGKFGEQYKEAHSGNGFNLYLKNLKRLKKVCSLCPSEVLWAPVWKPGHWLWRKWKGYI